MHRLGRGKELGTRYRRFEGSKVEEGHLCPRNSNSKYPWNSPLGNSAEGTDRGEADQIKAVLEENRFRMGFSSFQDLVDE